jgi:hypothetical protein
MGRAVLWVVSLFIAITALAAVLLSVVLQRPMASGRSGLDRLKAAAQTKQERNPNMPLVEVLSVTYRCGDKVFRPPEGVRVEGSVRVRVNGPCPDCYDGYGHPYFNGYVTCPAWESMTLIPALTSFPSEVDVPIYAGSSATTGYVSWTAEYCGGGTYESGTSSVQVLVESSPPWFGTPTLSVTGCTPLTHSASVGISRADSWSYRLLDSEGNPISGGTPNSPDTTACSFTATVTGITGAEQIEFTATNTNGSTTQAFTLPPPLEPHASISAEPMGILEGGSVTLTWSWSDAASASIDNGVGAVPPSGSTTVSPTETTTYTITAPGECEDATDSVEVYVQGVPRLPSASMRLIAQTGIASAKTAQLPASAQMRLMAQDLDRRPHSKISLCRVDAVEEVRTTHRKVSLSRVDARAQKRKISLARFDARANHSKVSLCRTIAIYADRTTIYARNVETGAVTVLGTIEGDAAQKTLTGVAIAPGTYEMWTTHDSTLFAGARRSATRIYTFRDDGPPIADPLPGVVNLASTIKRGVATITWGIAHPISVWGLSFGVWYSATSPVATFTTPTELVTASKVRTSFETFHKQTAAEYVAVALIGADGSLGPVAELALPWGVAPGSPVNQTAG